MAHRILVIGLGRFGTALALGLAERGVDVLGIDRAMEAVDALKDRLAYVLQLDSTDPSALQSIDAKSCSVAVVAIGEDFESVVLTVAALREIGSSRVIARARTARQARILKAVGATEIIEVETEVGRRLADSLASAKS